MTSWLRRTQAGIQSAPTSAVPGSALTPTTTNNAGHNKDPNVPDVRLDVESKCIYERRLPGDAYITAHVTRLQNGFYDSQYTHGDRIDHVRFVAIHLVFHPEETVNRFQAATVTVSIHDDTDYAYTDPPRDPAHRLSAVGPPKPRQKPRILRFAPHVLFGGVSPETLDWNFKLTGSLGTPPTAPAAASISPSGGIKGSYKMYQMMRIQGSSRTARARYFNGSGYDLEDGEVVWTMEENPLQKSGLPREMTFVMLITKGDVENVVFDIDIEPKIAAWYGHYPKWWCNQPKYRAFEKEPMDLDKELGQRFSPCELDGQFNFATLSGTFNDYVSLPGTTYSLTDKGVQDKASTGEGNPDTQFSIYAANINSKSKKSTSRQNTVQSQAQDVQAIPARAQSGPPQQPQNQSTIFRDEPMDYHIYLHNPRTINLHATPPPPSVSAPPQIPILSNPLHASDPIPRPRTTVPDRENTRSPANTKMKRRSIDITNLKSTNILSPQQSQAGLGIRSLSGGSGHSLRRSRSRTDLRSSPLIEDSHSSGSSSSRPALQRSRAASVTKADTLPALRKTSATTRHSSSSSGNSAEVATQPIPMEAPMPPDGPSGMLSPPLPAKPQNLQARPVRERLPFELRRNHSDSKRVDRQPRSRDSPSPMRREREITPSPGQTPNENSPEEYGQLHQPSKVTVDHQPDDELIDMRTTNDITPIPIRLHSPRREDNTALSSNPTAHHRFTSLDSTTPRASDDLNVPSPTLDASGARKDVGRRERTALREISPYANGRLEEDWDEAKGDLKKMRQRKRMSMPTMPDGPNSAYYSYVAPDTLLSDLKEVDREWEER